MKTFKKFLSALVMLSMIVGFFPVTAFAEEAVPGAAEETVVAYDPEVVQASGKNYICANGTPILVKKDGGNTYVYDIKGEKKLIDIPIQNAAALYGGTYDARTVSSANIIMESGSIDTIYGGGRDGSVKGKVEVIVKGGFVNKLYGGSLNGTVGSVKLEYNGPSDGSLGEKQALVVGGGYKGPVTGDIEIVLNNPNLTTLCGGTNGGAVNIGGDIDITVNGGKIANIYGGCVSGKVLGGTYITINGDTTVTTAFKPMNKNNNSLVEGGSYVYVPEGFNKDIITPGENIRIFQNEVQISGPPLVITDDGHGNIFANGNQVAVKADPQDSKTYIYDRRGNGKLLKAPVDNLNIFGGSAEETINSSNITMVSGSVGAIYGGGMNGGVSGDAFITIKGGTADSVIGGSYNGTVNGTSYISVAEGAASAVTGLINVGNAKAAVLTLPEGFSVGKVSAGGNTRIFVDGREMPNTSIEVPDHVTTTAPYVYANGIPIVIKKDINDGRTYIYDKDGKNKLLDTEVNGLQIHGGSLYGVVDSTDVTMESGTISRIYGGGRIACVTGEAKVTVTGGDITEVIYGGSYDGDVGSTSIRVTGPYVAKGVDGGSRNGSVLGDCEMVLDDNVGKGIYAGTGGSARTGYPSCDVFGDVSVTINGGFAEKIYGGCSSGVVRGKSTITLNGIVTIKDSILPQSNGGVLGGTTLNIPENVYTLNSGKITEGEGITINKTAPVEVEPAPGVESRTEEVLSPDGDEGKLVFRFLDPPEADGQMTGRTGDMIYITFPNGQNMLVDTASFEEECKDYVIGALKQMKVTHIDYLVATHYHSDHIGNTWRVLDEFDVGTLLKPGFKIPSGSQEYYRNLEDRINNPGKTFNAVDLWRGDEFSIGDVKFKVLHPENSDSVKDVMNGSPGTEDFNNNSIVLKMEYGEKTALLTGDLYIAAEFELLEAYKNDPEELKADLLKVPHHGDTTSSDPEFVAAVSPEIAVITHFGDTLIVNNRYKSVGADTYVTGVDGIVKVTLDGKEFDVITEYYEKGLQTAKPTANPAGGFVTTGTTVNLSCITPNAKIYYTTDGSMPTTTSTLYTGAITVTTDTTVKAIAVNPRMADSEVMTESYHIVSQPAVAVTGVSLDKNKLALTAGGAAGTLTAIVVPDNATIKNVTWSSGNESIATVAGGVVTPVSAGTTTITVTTIDGGYTDTCEVTVVKQSGGSGGGSLPGSGSPSDSTVVNGEVIDSETGQAVNNVEAKVTTEANGTKTVAVRPQGAIVFKQPDGTKVPVKDTSRLGFAAENNNSNIAFLADGTVEVRNMPAGTEAKIAVTYDLGNGQKLTIGTLNVSVGSDGSVALSITLIDPYGIITDSETGKPTEGANVILYYADTERNRAAGKVPGTEVELPILEDFKPNSNKNPQMSDASGAYGFMVFPTTDYYITAVKDGYELYRSPMISVEQEIVEWNFKMNKHLTGINRLSGLDRVDTAIEIAKAGHSKKVSNIILATANDYPDALAGSVLAYKLDAPVLLIGSTEVEQQKVIDYMKSNMEVSGTVYLLGGTGVIGSAVEGKISAAGFNKIVRLGGADRYETAIKIAGILDIKTGTPVVLVSGEDYPDALSVSSAAAVMNMPILPVQNDGISDAVKNEIARIKPSKIYIIGLEGAVSGVVENEAAAITSIDKSNVIRIGGNDRYETSLAVAKYFNLSGKTICAATGNDFPDALAGSVYAAKYNAPIILVDGSLPEDVSNYLRTSEITSAAIFGGEGAVSRETADQLMKLIGEQD